MNDIVASRSWIREQAEAWYQVSARLRDHKSAFEAIGEIGTLSKGSNAVLEELIPAFNQAKKAMTQNMDLGASATADFAALLDQTAQSYGATEQANADDAKGIG